MSRPIRLFIATHVRATRPVREVLERLRQMGRTLRTVYDDNLHVTLKFLGATDPELVPQLAEQITRAAGQQQAFDLTIRGLGCFPNPQRPRVVWAGLIGAEPLAQIAGELEMRLQPLGFAPEERAFQPHLTLARVRSRPPRELAALVEEQEFARLGEVRIDAVTLYLSETGTHGPKYSPMATTPLR